jgi:hypothetical protein
MGLLMFFEVVQLRPSGRRVANECSTWNWCSILSKAFGCDGGAVVVGHAMNAPNLQKKNRRKQNGSKNS